MSPEQVRGEKVNLRTDLFPLVAYSTRWQPDSAPLPGKQAPLLHNAILNSKPKPIRELNPRIPGQLKEIFNKALEKDVKQRYQNRGRTILRFKRQQITTASSRLKWSIAPALILILGIAAWFVVRPGVQKSGLPEIKQRQLTLNSADDAI